MAIELRLNPRKPGNYAFFCPVTKLHLTLSNPVGTTDRVSAYIVRAIKSKTLIDVNNVVNLKTGEVAGKVETKKEVKPEPVKPETAPAQEEPVSQEAEAVAEDKKVKKTKKNNSVDE